MSEPQPITVTLSPSLVDHVIYWHEHAEKPNYMVGIMAELIKEAQEREGDNG